MSHAVSGTFGRQFLFAVMAVDRGLVRRDAFVAAVNGWTIDKSVPLASRLVTMEAIDEAVAAEFEAIVDHHLREHGGNLTEYLAAVAEPVRQALAESLAANPDADVRRCVALLTPAAARDDGHKGEGNFEPGLDDDTFVPESSAEPEPQAREPWESDVEGPAEPGHFVSADESDKGQILRRSGRKWPQPMFEAGRFAAVKKIGGEGMGLIFLGYDKNEIGRIIALKTVRDDVYGKNYGKRLRLEGEIHGQLEHPNIVPVYGTGVMRDGSPFIALQHIRKGDLRKAIGNFHAGNPILPKNPNDSPYRQLFQDAQTEHADEPPEENADRTEDIPASTGFDPEAVSPIRFDKLRGDRLADFYDLLRRFTDICNAIDYAHDRGVLHRDLKPGNVMLGNHGETFVIDWGVAKLIDDPNADAFARADQVVVTTITDATQADTSPGTPSYMAPEQLDGENHRVDRRTDTFALGLILCEILTGEQPYMARISEELGKLPKDEQRSQFKRILRNAIRQGPPDLARKNPSIPRPLAAICRKALAFEQADRYQTARELAREVNRWLTDEPVEAYRGEERGIEKAARWVRRNRGKAAAMVASLVFATMGVILVATFLQILANQRFESQRQETLATKRDLLNVEKLAQSVSEKSYADSKATLKLAMSRGAWNQAIATIDDLETQIRTSKISVSPEERVDLNLDRLDALDGASRDEEAQQLVRSIEQDSKSNPKWFDKRRRGRLYLRKGDLFREQSKPGEASPFELALEEELTESERSYVMSLTEPDPKKAIAMLDAALAGDPYNIRAMVMITILRLLTGEGNEAIARLDATRSIMPQDNNLLILAIILDVLVLKKSPSETDQQRVLAGLGPREGRFLINGLRMLVDNDVPDSNSITKFLLDAVSLIGARKGPNQTARLDVLIKNPPASLVPLQYVFENLLNNFWILTTPEPPTAGMKFLMDRPLVMLRNRLGVPNRNLAERIAGYRAASDAYEIAEFGLFEALEQSHAGNLVKATEIFADLGEKDAFRDSWRLRKSVLLLITKKLTDSGHAWIVRARSPVGPGGVVTEPMRDSIRKILGKMANDERPFDAFDLDIAFQLSSLIEDYDTSVLIFSNQMRIDPKGGSFVFLRFVKAMIEPMAMIEYLKVPNGGLKGDVWTALRVRIHRDYPELAKSVRELNDMPENPFQPTSVDHPQPFIYNIHTNTVPKLIESP